MFESVDITLVVPWKNPRYATACTFTIRVVCVCGKYMVHEHTDV